MFNKPILSTIVYFVFVLFVSVNSFGQSMQENSTTSIYFAQGYFSTTEGQDLEDLKNELSLNANVSAYRFDIEHSLFIVFTNEMELFDKTVLLSWFGNYISAVSCTQIGVQNVNERNVFPFQNCND